MNLSPYPNLCKAEKKKSTLRILLKDFYSVFGHMNYAIKKEYKIFVFLMASNWCSPTIVSNVSCISYCNEGGEGR